MGQARLTRIDAVREMAAAVDAFRAEATAALENLDMEIRRVLEWIHHDRHDHWNHQVRREWERITEARVQLQQAMTARRIDEHDPACIDEKKALARAKQRLETAQEKVEAVRHCARAVDHAVDDYRGARTPLASWLESEGPKALATLRRIMDNLEDYLSLQGAGSGPGTCAAGGGEVAAGVSPATTPPSDASGATTQQSDGVPVILPAPRPAAQVPRPLPAEPEGGIP